MISQARNLEFLNDCLDDMMGEQQKITNHARAAQRQQREYMHWLNKRRQENVARRCVRVCMSVCMSVCVCAARELYTEMNPTYVV